MKKKSSKPRPASDVAAALDRVAEALNRIAGAIVAGKMETLPVDPGPQEKRTDTPEGDEYGRSPDQPA